RDDQSDDQNAQRPDEGIAVYWRTLLHASALVDFLACVHPSPPYREGRPWRATVHARVRDRGHRGNFRRRYYVEGHGEGMVVSPASGAVRCAGALLRRDVIRPFPQHGLGTGH